MNDVADDPSTEAHAPTVELPTRDAPGGDAIADWCSELVARVRPGGFTPASEPPRSPALAGRYRLLHRLGAGGVGEIHCAEHVGLGKRVAVKLLLPELARDPEVRRRFLREGRLAAAVRHPGVVDITDVGETEDGRAFLVMELLEGRTIADEVRWSGALPWARARPVLVQLAEALAYAHARGVIHRDLKPSNVMLTGRREDGSDRCTLIDFGMARARLGVDESTELTRTGLVLGSPAYMSPEQFRGEPADARSDVYSLGCLAYFMLVGRRPFDGSTPARLMYQHLMAPLPRPRGIVAPPGRHAAIRSLLAKACAKRPEQRWQTMEELLAAIHAVDRAQGSWIRRRTLHVGLVAGASSLAVVALQGDRSDERSPSAPVGGSSEPRAAAVPPATSAVPSLPQEPRCGDGEPQAPERCDDGNLVPADGCEPDCTPTEILDVRAGRSFTCALTRAGHVRCWGQQGPHLGQPSHPGNIGDDELPCSVPPLDFGPRRVTALSFEYWAQHACVVLDDGTARCWGRDGTEQLGLGPGVTHWGDAAAEHPAALPPLALPPKVHAIHTHEVSTCALAGRDPARPGLYCWGSNSHGQLGQGHVLTLAEPPAEPVDLGGKAVRQLGVGIVTACGLLEDGTVRCWGGNRNLQLGNGWPRDRYLGDGRGDGRRGLIPNSAALDVQGLEGFEVALVRVNGGWNCVVSVDGRVRCWGGNDEGAMGYRHDQIPGCDPAGTGLGCLMPRPSVDVELGELGKARVIDLQMGRLWACVLDDAGAVRCWGSGSHGRLGYGTRLREATGRSDIGHHLTPAEAYAAMGNGGVVDVGDLDRDGAIDPVARISLGYAHACAIARDGTLRCWGENASGELGYGTTDAIGDDETPGEHYAARHGGPVPVFGGDGCRARG